MSFYHYSQNNSGGSFDFEEGAITHHVVIEADSATEADARAETLGLYFDGCGSGRDCDCCGDRWSPAYGEGDPTPSIYGQDVSDGFYKEKYAWGWMGDNPDGYIHYKDGTVVPVELVKEEVSK